jgi:formate dehydrogenase subunit delta
MDPHHLVKMANNIASFFEVETDRAKGAKAVADHIRAFWEPRMRRDIFRYLDAENGAGLSELALAALRDHRQELIKN